MMQKKKKFTLLFALIILALSSTARSLEGVSWVLPPPNSLVPEKTLTIQGYVKAPLKEGDELVVKHLAKGGSSRFPVSLTMEGRVFSAKIEVKEGQNDVLLGNSVLSVLFAPDSKANREGKFTRFKAHAAAEKKCDSCHSLWEGEIVINEEFPKLCIGCHKKLGTVARDIAVKSNEHTKKVTQFCIGCHLPHGSENPKLLKWDELKTCSRCHEKRGGGAGHEIAGGQSCAFCHDSHLSSFPSLLKKSSPQTLCIECHKDRAKRLPGMKSAHAPAMGGKCFECHLSHKGKEQKLLKEASASLCIRCHDKARVKLHEERLGDCSSCHLSHQSERDKLVRNETAKACVDCHQEKAGSQGHFKGASGDCITCHDPHKSTAELTAQICGKCHNSTLSEFQNTHGNLPIKSASQCVLCHNPHLGEGNPGKFYGALHYPVRNGGCGVCHVVEDGKVGLRYAKSETCYRCHGDTVGTATAAGKDTVHSPVANDACTACHNPHIKQRDKMLLIDPKDLCKWCHGEERESKKFLHGALKDKDCRACHLPHISDAKPLLPEKQPEICISCHKKTFKTPPAQDKLAHGIVKTGKCSACHDPHSEDNKGLIRGGADAACKNCHPKVLLDEYGKQWTNYHGPIASGSCTACHELRHSHKKGTGDKFLTAEQPDRVCDQCHEVAPKHIPPDYLVRERVRPDSCLACHNPHGARNSLMLKRMAY
ncbi:hypothetical protein EPN96_01515 [bacterium]|nr:MAG: hypothetical protein EPN96_01515 [bacterium]